MTVAQTDNSEHDVYEVTFRDMINYRPADRSKPCDLFFLSIDEKEPPAEFLGRFQDLSVSVKSIADAQLVKGKGVFDKATGKAGIVLNVGEITWRDKQTAVVLTDYLGRPESENLGFSYDIKLQEGRWAVASSGLLYAN